LTNFLTVTETPGAKASKEQIERLYHRYHFAVPFCQGKDVLEVACGAGMGLGYLSQSARKVVGADIDDNILHIAKKHYAGRDKIEIRNFEAQDIPFSDRSFDVVIMYEAIYYLPQPEKFIGEAARVLRDDGVLIVCTVNKQWSDFNPSPFSVRYYSSSELADLLKPGFSRVQLYGAFPAKPNSGREKLTSAIKRMAVSLHLMPKTMKGKELFKSVFFGPLSDIPAEITEGLSDYGPSTPIAEGPTCLSYKVLYAVGSK
jgi:ubiquinone/menaquinone biosynthesis C-methylase UbiE